jgi:uncharacterized ParB-like nuclease family protein
MMQMAARNALNSNRSIHADHIAEIHMVPVSVIIRPILPVLDEEKVKSLMETITNVCIPA